VIVMPLLMMLVLVSVHIGLWFHARHVANAAAQEGARAARAAGAIDADGEASAEQFIHALGSTALTDPTVTVTRGPTTVTVTVTAKSPVVIPGLILDVRATSTSPIEQFTA